MMNNRGESRTSIFPLNILDFYILLWCIYMQQGLFFPAGSIIYQAILIVVWSISFYYAIIALTKYTKPVYFKGLGWILSTFLIYGFFLLISGERLILAESGLSVPNFSYVKNLLNSLLPIYPFYVFGKKGYFTNIRLIVYPVVFVLLSIYSFFTYQTNTLLERVSSESFEITNNVGYTFVAIIPLLVLLKRNFLRYILFAICIAFALLSVKRGAIVTGLTATVFFMFNSLKNSKRGVKFFTFFSVMAIGAGIYYLASYLMENNAYFQYRLEKTIEENDTSARSIVYSALWNHFLNESSLLNQIFGNGAFATTKFAMNFAHNDWLEILIDHGVLGILLYVAYWFFFFKTWRLSNIRNDGTISTAILLIMLIYFLKTFFSMSYYSMEIYASFTLGYCLSQVPRTCNRRMIRKLI